ncbi:aminotransferase class V-fold PLP-dependent enzyme [Bacillus sp. JJ1532]|uniref:aminotransferase class V-fold PLP-dependent enzyme n=1 Tax=Bacillus sp. JJ1532 TaxID=3122958 RepID=UPI002FFEA223
MKKIYLDNAATTLVNPRVLEVSKKFTDMLRDTNLSTSDVTRVQRSSLVTARQDVADFLGCDREEIALVQCTSHALGILVDRLPLKKEDNVLICDLEYQASTVCWKRRQDEVGFELRQVKTSGGQVTADNFRRYIDNNTKVILLASVQEINGFRADVKEIGKLAKEYGCYYIVDGIQEVGSLQVNVRDIGMDFYCSGGKKWLGNPFGMGFLYIKREHLKTLKPSYYSYFDIQVPSKYADYLTYLEDPRRHPFDEYVLAEDASVFEIGGYGNYIGAMGLSESIHVLNDFGIENVERKNIKLNKQLYNGLRELGVFLESPGVEDNMSSIVSFNFNRLKNNNIEKERRLIRYLQDHNIYVSLRCSTGVGGVRVSVHYYSTEEEVDIFLAAVKNFMEIDRNVE